MSATAAIAASASAQSAIAAQQAREARKVACQGMMPVYQDATASAETRQSYAECIKLMYPKEMSGGEVAIIKVLIIAALAGAIVGLFKGWREEGFAGSLIFAFFGMILFPAAIAIIALLAAGVEFLFH